MDFVKLNLRDKKLLESLCENSRRSLGELSKEIGISKQAVLMKMKKMQEKVIVKYVTLLNYYAVGYKNTMVFLKIQGLRRDSYSGIIKKLQKINNISWISTFVGDYDLALSIFYRDQLELYNALNLIYILFKKSIKEKRLHTIHSQHISPFSFFNNKKVIDITYQPQKRISEIDKEILNLIDSNSRFEWHNLSEKLKLNYKTIKRHIADLEKKNIILGYGIILNYPILGFSWNICILEISHGSKISSILKELKQNSSIPFISTTLENYMIIDYLSKDYEELKSFLDGLQQKYFEEIESYKILNVLNLEKLKDYYK